MASGAVEPSKAAPACTTAMRAAVAFGMVLIVLGVFMPGVLGAMNEFLLQFFSAATSVLKTLPQQTAIVNRAVR